MNKKSTLRSVANDYLTHPKEGKGITLVALVITIIVLLILAGVAISTLSGRDNIIKQAQKARDDYNLASADEDSELSDYQNKIEKYTKVQEEEPVDWAGTYNYISGNDSFSTMVVHLISGKFDISGNGNQDYSVSEGKLYIRSNDSGEFEEAGAISKDANGKKTIVFSASALAGCTFQTD